MGAANHPEMDAGLPALLVLVCLLITLGIFLRCVPVQDYAEFPEQTWLIRRTICGLSVIAATTGTVFWIWAFVNCVDDGFDFGIISFAVAAVSASAGLKIAKGSDIGHAQAFTGCIAVSCAVPSVNYLIGAILEDGAWMIFYCIFGAVLWAVIAVWLGFASGRLVSMLGEESATLLDREGLFAPGGVDSESQNVQEQTYSTNNPPANPAYE